jgi:hypothetical protein
VGSGGFEPPKTKSADLQSAPFGHSGNCPCTAKLLLQHLSRRWDSNPRPTDYKSVALPAELLRQKINVKKLFFISLKKQASKEFPTCAYCYTPFLGMQM